MENTLDIQKSCRFSLITILEMFLTDNEFLEMEKLLLKSICCNKLERIQEKLRRQQPEKRFCSSKITNDLIWQR